MVEKVLVRVKLKGYNTLIMLFYEFVDCSKIVNEFGYCF